MRLRRVEYAVPLLAHLSTSHVPLGRITDPFPADAEFVYAFLSPDGRTVNLVFTHPSFDDVPPGREMPSRVLTYETPERAE